MKGLRVDLRVPLVARLLSPSSLRAWFLRVHSELGAKLLAGAFWSLAGAAISRSLLLVANVVAGRLLGVAEFGMFGLVQGTAALFGAVAGASLGLAATRLVAQTRWNDPALAGQSVVKAYRLTLLLGGLGTLCVAVLAGELGRGMRAVELLPALRLASLLVLLGALNGVQTGILAGFEEFRALAQSSVLRGLLSCVCIGWGCLQGGVLGAVAGQVVAEVLSAGFFHFAIVSSARGQGVALPWTAQLSPKPMRALAALAFPTLIGTLVLQPVFWFCNVLLTRSDGFAELGMFMAAERWRQVLLFLPASLSANVFSSLSRLEASGDTRGFRGVFINSLALILAAVVVPGLAVIVLGKWCLGLFGEGYEGGVTALAVLVASCIPIALNNSLGQILVTRGRQWWRLGVDVLLAGLLLIFALALVPQLGASGLAWASLLAYAGATLGLVVALRQVRQAKREPSAPIRLLHMTTAPETLHFLRGQLGYMKAAGYEVEAVSSPDAELTKFGEEQQIQVWPLAMSRAITPWHDARALVGLVRLLRRRRPTILHAHTPKAGLIGMVAGTVARTPLRIYHLHGLPLETAQGHRRVLLRAAEWVSCRLAHRVLAVSPSLRDSALSHGLVQPDKISVPAGGSINGVDAHTTFRKALHWEASGLLRERLELPPDAIVVGFVGRIVRDKGIVELAEAWQDIRQRCPRAYLILIGPTELTDPVPPQTLERLRGDPRVRLLDRDWKIAPYIAAMDLLVLPTHREGLGMVLLEAAAMELPVVASRTTGCIDVVCDGETGILVPPKDVAALARAIATYVESPSLRNAHGAAARTHVIQRFSQEVVWRAMAEVYVTELRQFGLRRSPGAPNAESINATVQLEGEGT